MQKLREKIPPIEQSDTKVIFFAQTMLGTILKQYLPSLKQTKG